MLKEQLLQDFKDAMREKDALKKDTITMIRAAILQIEKDTQKELSENEVMEIISKELKKRKETLTDLEKSGREDLISKVNDEINIIKAYLPAELSREELEQIVSDTVAQLGASSMKDMGKVMQALKEKTAGRADNRLVNELVKAKLA
ncbi:MAG: GatB/YqeY domain-containing protein [Clostridia bacterium]|nr:GatB/YqeY domain-containing protein [Clostridia bacterium]